MSFCTYSDIALLTNISTSDISNTDVTSIISEATKFLNSLINIEITREEIDYIDETRQNKIDGSNKTYYVSKWKDNFFGDTNSDGSVTTSDIIVYAVYSDGTETIPTIASISTVNKSFTLTTAVNSSYRLYVSYTTCFRNSATPDPLIALACKYFAASMCYAKVNIGRSPEVNFGNQRILRHMASSDFYFKKAMSIVDEINYRGANLYNSTTGIW